MERENNKAYRIAVQSENGNSNLICIIESFKLIQSEDLAHFWELVSNISDISQNEKEKSNQDFKSEMQNSRKSTLTLSKELTDLNSWIQNKMKDVYGKECIIEITQI